LLKKGHDTIGTLFWQEILSITNKWEKTSGIEVHKGTPYFFLAENYLLLGDRDLAFTYLYNALQDDKMLGNLTNSINYPKTAPSYLTGTMNPNQNNQMYYLVAELRTKLSEYIFLFNNRYPRPQPFTILDFDVKFLANDDLVDIVTFFVFNFLYLADLEKNTRPILLKNQFSRLKAMDTIFNFCLVIDETLKYAESKKVSITHNHYISDGILWLVCDYQRWMTRDNLTDFWGSNHLDLNNTKIDLEQIIPRLLAKNEIYKNKNVRGEIFDLLLVYKLRNYGGHNIKEQKTLTNDHDDIINGLFFSLFLCVEAI
jgi:hypothetical protein